MPAETGANTSLWLDRTKLKLCRLRFFVPGRWSLAIYSYAHERYEASVFADGGFVGRPQDGFDLAANLYLG